MSKKLLDTTHIANELRGASAFFPKSEPSDQPTNRRNVTSTERPSDQPSQRQLVDVTNRPIDLTSKQAETGGDKASRWRREKKLIRAAFDLYEDQVHQIRRIRAERELAGASSVSLSDIAREAFDLLFEKLGKGKTRPADQPSQRHID
jgi:hypothetical protein